MRGPAPELRLSGGRLDVRWPDGGTALRDVRAVCRVLGREGPTQHVGGPWRRAAEGFRARCGPLEITLIVGGGRGALELRFEATAVDLVRARELGLRATPELGGGPPEWLLHLGYQSWDAAGVATFQANARSWWTCGLANAAGAGIALAAGGATRHATRFDAADGTIAWLQVAPEGGPGEAWMAQTGSRFASEPVLVSAASDVQAELGRLTTRGRRRGRPPRGWLSWYHLGPWVDTEAMLANSALVAEGVIPGLEAAVIQLDDGWQTAYGDWAPNAKFRDLAGMCATIRDRGQTPGVWTAPFLVSASSDLDAKAPETWFVRDEKTGARLVDDRHVVFGPMHVLDARVPAVRAHLERVFRELRELGFGYFKIDFLYAGAYVGLDAFRSGLRAIRRGCGRDAYLLACGAPLLPVVGIADGCRIGPDTCTPLFNPEAGGPEPTVFGDEIQNVARNLAAARQLRGWFDIDADVALAGGNLTAGQARQLLTLVALSGGLYFVSDDLTQLARERLASLANPELTALLDGAPAAAAWEPGSHDAAPSVWRRRDGVTALYNWGAAPVWRAVRTASGDAAVDLWDGSVISSSGGVIEVEVEPGDVRLLRA
ncbi:MAG TPA: glycoside hydrolase family 36 protein [Candidatus Dormibacteraeota bacterium]